MLNNIKSQRTLNVILYYLKLFFVKHFCYLVYFVLKFAMNNITIPIYCSWVRVKQDVNNKTYRKFFLSKWVKIGKLLNLFFESIYEHHVEKVLDFQKIKAHRKTWNHFCK